MAAAMSSRLRAALRLALFAAWTIFMLVPYLPMMAVGSRHLGGVARAYWRGVVGIIGMRVVVRGDISTARPTLFVANHASYLDIVVLGRLLDAVFVAKREVAGWPGFGFLARVGRTVFVERNRVRVTNEREALHSRLGGGQSLILFPEGTSNDGNRVLPFKSALFSVAEADELTVQPVSVAYTRIDGVPIGHGWRPFFAWYGDMTLAPHLWTMMGIGRLTVEVVFHPPLAATARRSRKVMAERCHRAVARGVGLANAGRLPADDPPPEEVAVR